MIHLQPTLYISHDSGGLEILRANINQVNYSKT